MFTNPVLWLCLLFLPIAAIIAAHFRWSRDISALEAVLGITILTVASAGGWLLLNYAGISDIEVLNGAVTDKTSEHVSCSHSYDCHCTTDKQGNRSCDTCYRHPYDIDYTIRTTVGNIDVSPLDEQGLIPAPEWINAKIGEPASRPHRYINYIQGAPQSIFYRDPKSVSVPAYPEVFDDYRYNRILQLGTSLDTSTINDAFNKNLKTLGAQKQVNIIVVFTNKTSDFADDLRVGWLGGKKNDVIVVLGMIQDQFSWVRVFSWSDHDIFNIELRDRLTALGHFDAKEIVDITSNQISKNFTRKPMKEYAYLIHEYRPAMWAICLYTFLLWATAGGIIYWLYQEDVV